MISLHKANSIELSIYLNLSTLLKYIFNISVHLSIPLFETELRNNNVYVWASYHS